jgi:hypothetical protein
MLSPREITVPPSARTWTNEKMGYTHGYGLAMTRVTLLKRSLPKLLVKDIPPVSPYGLNISRPEIYFRESPIRLYPGQNPGKKNSITRKGMKTFIPLIRAKPNSHRVFLPQAHFCYRFGSTDLLITSPDSQYSFVIPPKYHRKAGTLFPFLRLDE